MSVNPSLLNPQQLAEACAATMYSRDNATKNLGMTIKDVSPGMATLEMNVVESMLQGYGACHGGFIFSLADSAFAFACNTYNKSTVALGCNIDFVVAANLGDKLTAYAKELSRGNRTGVYSVRIENQRDELVAVFTGKSYQIRGVLIEE